MVAVTVNGLAEALLDLLIIYPCMLTSGSLYVEERRQ